MTGKSHWKCWKMTMNLKSLPSKVRKKKVHRSNHVHVLHHHFTDWEDAETLEPELWEENWDDDIVDEDFSKQLRMELEKKGFKEPPSSVLK
jgi:hypothetical protein